MLMGLAPRWAMLRRQILFCAIVFAAIRLENSSLCRGFPLESPGHQQEMCPSWCFSQDACFRDNLLNDDMSDVGKKCG